MNYRLQVLDYVVVFVALVFSALGGFYYGIIKKKNNTVEEYFLASRELSVFKMACSLFATIISSGSIVGFVAEVYSYGSQPMLGFIVSVFAFYAYVKLFFPIVHRIGSFDMYKYYELRFNKEVRYFLSATTIVEKILFSSIVIYGTSTSLSKVMGVHIWIIITVLNVICITYSALGGVRGVTIADMIQAFVIIIAVSMVSILGLTYVGGLTVVWERNWTSGRIEFFNFELSPTTRHTFWTATIAATMNSFAVTTTNPSGAQRVMATSMLKKSQRAAAIGLFMYLVFSLLCGFIGLICYGLYYDCDPLTSGIISNSNQLISLFVGETLYSYQGLCGLFFAGLLCAAISTLSSNLNTLSALSMETFVKPFHFVSGDEIYTRLAKLVVIIIGLLSMLGIALVQRFPNVYQASLVLGFVNGPHFALLLIGTLFPQAKLKCSIVSLVVGIMCMLWILIGSLLVNVSNLSKPVSIAGCSLISNATTVNFVQTTLNITSIFGNITDANKNAITNMPAIHQQENMWDSYFPISAISFLWYPSVGIAVTLLTFFLSSLIFGAEKERMVDLNLIPDQVKTVHNKLSSKWKKILLCDVYSAESNEMTRI